MLSLRYLVINWLIRVWDRLLQIHRNSNLLRVMVVVKLKKNKMKVAIDKLLIVILVQLLEDSLSRHNHSKSHNQLP